MVEADTFGFGSGVGLGDHVDRGGAGADTQPKKAKKKKKKPSANDKSVSRSAPKLEAAAVLATVGGCGRHVHECGLHNVVLAHTCSQLACSQPLLAVWVAAAGGTCPLGDLPPHSLSCPALTPIHRTSRWRAAQPDSMRCA